MKRIFIAAGSEALKGVTALVKRLCEENLFGRFEDRYVAIDSMPSEVAAFNALGTRLHTPRVKGYVLKISDGDGDVERSFQPSWTAKAVPAGGVGGDRSVSGKAAEFIRKTWDEIEKESPLEPNDQIVVVGSAFGGTSGGLFLNICDFLDLQILRKRTADTEFKNVVVLGFLIMPEAVPGEGNYPIALNMISMFKDLQTASWRRRLESERPGFKVPVWAQKEGSSFPLFTGAKPDGHVLADRGISGSSLPMGNLYILPTPRGHRPLVTSLLSEQLFAATYLHVEEFHSRWVDRLIAGQAGPAYSLDREDPCFSAFNMFVMKSGRMVSLKNAFYKSLIAVLDGKDGRAGFLYGSGVSPTILENVKSVFVEAQLPEHRTALAGVNPAQCIPLDALLQAEERGVVNERSLLEFKTSFRELLEAVRNGVPEYRVVPAKELIVLLACSKYSDWNGDVNADIVGKGYEELYAKVQSLAANAPRYAAEMVKSLNDAIALVSTRTKNRLVRDWPFGLGMESEVFREVADAFRKRFRELLGVYVCACRCARTPFIGTEAFLREVADFKNECGELKLKLRRQCSDLHGGTNPYIIDGNLVEPLEPLQEEQARKLEFDPFRVVMSIVYRKCVTDKKLNAQTVADMNDRKDSADLLLNFDHTADQILEIAEESVLNRFIDIADQLPPGANPLASATLLDFSAAKDSAVSCKTSAPEFAVPDSQNFHYHYVIRQGGMPPGFKMTNGDVCDVLKLTTMPNTANSADPFLSVNHSSGIMNPNMWKDENTTTSPLYKGMKDSAPVHVQGLWIGTLGIDFTANGVLSRIYSSVPHVKLAWIRAGMAPSPRTTMTLSEMIRFGVVMEAIECKLNEAWKKYKALTASPDATVLRHPSPVKFSFSKDGEKFELPAATLRDVGVVDNHSDGTCQFASISVEWTGLILAWIRSAKGFASFYPMAKFISVMNCETDVFAALRFSIRDSEIDELNAVKSAIMASLRIHGL